MTPLSDSEARTVQRFEAAEPAPESWGGGLWEALESEVFAGVLRQIAADSDLHSTMYANLDPRPIVRDLLALPEIAALRAKADAADRVCELADALEADSARLLAVEWRSGSGRQYADGIREGQNRAATEIRRALDGDPEC